MMATRSRASARPAALPNPFGDFLRRVMEAQELRSVADLTRLLDVEQPTVSRWLSGRSEPSLENMRKVATRLDVSLGELMVAAGVVTEDEIGAAAAQPSGFADVLVDIQAFINRTRGDQSARTKRVRQDLLKMCRGMLNMSIEAIEGIPVEPQMRRKRG